MFLPCFHRVFILFFSCFNHVLCIQRVLTALYYLPTLTVFHSPPSLIALLYLPTQAHVVLAQEYPLKLAYITNRDGDHYQDLRWRYENGEEVFDYSWKCPFNRHELEKIAKKQVHYLASPFLFAIVSSCM